jgi:uncharacterized protein
MSDTTKIGEMYLKIHRSGREVIAAICDCDLMGRKFCEGPLRVEIHAGFFGEDKASAKEVEEALSKATIANLIGEQSVDQAIRLGYVSHENVLLIQGVPCAQMVLM